MRFSCLQTFESWRDKIPDMEWMKEYFPDSQYFDGLRDEFNKLQKNLRRIQMPEFELPGSKVDILSAFVLASFTFIFASCGRKPILRDQFKV
jgi:hypothetical protein